MIVKKCVRNWEKNLKNLCEDLKIDAFWKSVQENSFVNKNKYYLETEIMERFFILFFIEKLLTKNVQRLRWKT